MRKTVVIGQDSYLDIDMDEFDLHSEVLFHTSEKLNLNPKTKEQFYLGKLFIKNKYVALQISDYFTIAYLPQYLNSYQVSIINNYADEFSKYAIVLEDSEVSKFHTMNNIEFLEQVHLLENSIIKK